MIAKANTDASAATQLRYQLYDGLEYTEYVQPLAPSIYGHPLARGATAVAAYDPFRPFLPEDYTSVGGDLPIYYHRDDILTAYGVPLGGNSADELGQVVSFPSGFPTGLGWSTRRARALGRQSSGRSATGSARAGRRSTATAI